MRKRRSLPIAVCDCETDPFQLHRRIDPFVWGFFSEETGYRYFYDEPDEPLSCTADFVTFLQSLSTSFLIYAHNGGRFDYVFLNRYWSGKILVINNRLTRANLFQHEIRDSFSILPVSLDTAANKGMINYSLMLSHKRHVPGNKSKILTYLEQDCRQLHHVVSRFRAEFGDKLTMASAAMASLNKTYAKRGTPYRKLDRYVDSNLRQFYFGGRTQIFHIGEARADYHIFDVNSMYPFVMKSKQHPIGSSGEWTIGTDVTDATRFVCLDATSHGAFPLRTRDGLRFPHARSPYLVSIHEYLKAISLNLCTVHKIIYTYDCVASMDFSAFIDKYYQLRMKAASENDAVLKLFYKLVMNSAYGKFGINPMNYNEYQIITPTDTIPDPSWQISYELFPGTFVYARPNSKPNYLNVAIAASITGGARALLMESLYRSEDALYCDTDSIIARSLEMPQNDTLLGAFKHEAEFTQWFGIAPKLYACLDRDEHVIKCAHKGIPEPSLKQWRQLIHGERIQFSKNKEAPTLNLIGSQSYLLRNVGLAPPTSLAFVPRRA